MRLGLSNLLAGALLAFAWQDVTVPAAEPSVLEAQARRIAMIERVAPSVVAIFSSSGDGGGSGVLISSDGYALSNFHVTSGAGSFMKCGLNDGRLYDAVIVGIDPTGDVALIKLLGRDDFPAATMGDSDQVAVGDSVFAMGNPFLLATDFHPTVTAGIVSGVHRYQYPAGTFLEYTDCIQTDASINPGNSGGPLFSAEGELIGINGRGSFEKRGRVNVGAGYAISINQIRHFLDHLKGGRIVDHATLGATVTTNFDRQVVVDRVLETSSAYRRGLRSGDEIVSFAGRSIGSANQFKNVLGIYPDGWKVPLTFRRDGMQQDVLVELRALHRATEMMPGPGGAPKPPEGEPSPDRPGKDKPGRDDPRNDKPRPDAPHPERPDLPHGHPEAVEPPAAWKHLFEEKAGYANYYFNQQLQQRVLATLLPMGSQESLGGRWKLAGTINEEAFVLTLASQGLGLKIGGKQVYFVALDGGEPVDEPPGTGGLLYALDQFRQLLAHGPDAFSVFDYRGSEPLDGRGPMVDVLHSEVQGLHTRWFFRQTDGQFVGFDTALARDVDPCEIRVHAWDQLAGRVFPSALTVRCGDREFGTLRITSAELQPPAAGEMR